jgi:serine/threonine-protein kinase
VLSVAEASLARFVGPLARVLVRNVARDCQDVETLYARLAEQVTDPGARATFIGQATAAGLTSVARASSTAAAAPAATQGTAMATSCQPLSEQTLAEAKRLLAPHVGPIAGVLVKRSAARAPQREAFVAALLEAVSEPRAREQLRVALAGLP